MAPHTPNANDVLRCHADPDEAFFDDPFLLDRHRIIHSTSFRRLQYKTQVFLPFEADHFRNRMTHTLEVAQMGQVLARRFGANAQVLELICLAHDLGHTPFGHAGEHVLNQLTSAVGGFEHNDQSLRVVTELEKPYPWFAGLNLTAGVLNGLRTHAGRYDRVDATYTGASPIATPTPSLESSLAAWSDRLAYDAGDLEDAIGAEMLTADALNGLTLWRWASERLSASLRDRPIHVVRRVLCEAIQRIVIAELRVAGATVVCDSAILDELNRFEEHMLNQVYLHSRVARNAELARRVLTRLFEWFTSDPHRLPVRFARRVGDEVLLRVVADYISGMTDRFCLRCYREIFPDDADIASLRDV
jgi:dGTPase